MTPAAEGGNRDRGRCCISECSRFGAGWGRGNLFSTIFRMPIAIGFRGAIVINMNSATQNEAANLNRENSMDNTTAVIHTAPTGRYHVSPDGDMLYEDGRGHYTKGAALRMASRCGYTHYNDHTYGGKALNRRIPARYR